DAFDMGALPQDESQAVDVVAALRAGVDLLLATSDRRAHRRIERALVRAAELGLVDAAWLARSTARLADLRRWLSRFGEPRREVVAADPPTDAEIAAVRERAAYADVVVVGTIAVSSGSPQARLVEALAATGRPLVTVALRTPWDVEAYPMARTHVCTYSILPGS